MSAHLRLINFIQIGDILPNAKKDDKPSALALHSLYGFVFFINKLPVPTVERISLNGLFRKIITVEGLVSPRSLVVDEKFNLLYIMSDVSIIEVDLEGHKR